MQQPLDLSDADHIRDLDWYDGPLMSIWSTNGKFYIGAWHDDETREDGKVIHIWLVAEVGDVPLQEYTDGKRTYRDLLENSPALYKGENNYWYADSQPLQPVNWADIPEEDRPTKDSLYTDWAAGNR